MYRAAIVLLPLLASMAFPQEITAQPRAQAVEADTPPEILRKLISRPADPRPTQQEIDRRFAARSVYRGTVLKPAAEFEQNLFRRIAQAFREQDPTPDERLAGFRFCLSLKHIAVVGWNGSVKSITPKDDGIYEIVMEFRPDMVARRGGVVYTPTFTKELWRWDGKALQLAKLESQGLGAVFID